MLEKAYRRAVRLAPIQDSSTRSVTVQELLGHRDPKRTMRSAHLSPAHKAAAVSKLGAALAPVPAPEPAATAAGVPNLERS